VLHSILGLDSLAIRSETQEESR